MLTLYRPISQLFRDDFFDRDPWSMLSPMLGGERAEGFNPAVDIVEKDDAYLVKAEVPGVAPEDIDVQVEDDVLTLRGERKHESDVERGGYRRVERSYGAFARSFVLPKGTNADAIEAHMEHGLLTLTIPKPVSATARKIEVKGPSGLVDKAKKLFAKAPEAPSAQA